LAGAVIGALARAPFVLLEASLARFLVVRHRALCQIPSLMRLDHRTPTRRDRYQHD